MLFFIHGKKDECLNSLNSLKFPNYSLNNYKNEDICYRNELCLAQ